MGVYGKKKCVVSSAVVQLRQYLGPKVAKITSLRPPNSTRRSRQIFSLPRNDFHTLTRSAFLVVRLRHCSLRSFRSFRKSSICCSHSAFDCSKKSAFNSNSRNFRFTSWSFMIRGRGRGMKGEEGRGRKDEGGRTWDEGRVLKDDGGRTKEEGQAV